MDNVTSNLTSSPSTVSLSQFELWMQAVFFYFFLCGIASNFFCWLITIAIWRSKNLRSRFFIIVGFLMLSRGLVNTMGLSTGLYRILRNAGLVGTDFKRLICISIHFNLYFCWTIEMSIMCTLVIDRMLAIMAASFYRRFNRRSAVYICLAQYVVISLVKIIPTLTIDPLLVTASCINMYAPINPIFSQFSQYIDFAIAILIIILYAILIGYIRITVKAQAAEGSGALSVTLERQLKLIPVLRNLVLIHFGFMFPGKLLNMLASVVPLEYQQRMVAYGGMILNIDVFANAILLLVTNADIREAAVPCLMRENKVHPSQPSNMSNQSALGKGKQQMTVQMVSGGHA